MAKKPVQRIKHVPQRTCVGCRTVLAKRQMIRLVRTPNGVMVDPTGKQAGRGAYLHDRRECWEKGLQGGLAHALKAELGAEDRERLEAYMHTLPEELGASPVSGQTAM
ncbi:MAG TPA: YlxR family protein [Anaerolineales bacterium]